MIEPDKNSAGSGQPKGSGTNNVNRAWEERGIAEVIENESRLREDVEAPEKMIRRITKVFGSTVSIWLHIAFFSAWIVCNVLMPARFRWDPYPFTFLTLVVSLEAIFLSTFILVSENRESTVAERRGHLDLQINLLAERENTKMLVLLDLIASKLGIQVKHDAETEAMEHDLSPTDLLKKIDECMKSRAAAAESVSVHKRLD